MSRRPAGSAQKPRWSLSPLGAVVLGMLVVGLVLLFLTSGAASIVGFALVALTLVFLVADLMPFGRTARLLPGGRFAGQRVPTTPDPQYIETAEEPSEADWLREEQRYRRKNEPG